MHRPRTTLAARLRLAAAIVAVIGLAAACADDGADAEAIGGLAILSGDVGATRLTIHAARGGDAREIDPPDAATAWLSSGPDGVLVATTADGRLAIQDVDDDPDGSWRFVSASDGSGSRAPVLFGAVSPDGERVAGLTLGSAGQFGLAIVATKGGASITFPLDGEPMLGGPAWIDDDRVGVVTTRAEGGGAVSIADVGSGDLTGGQDNLRAFALSADGSTVAWVSDEGRLWGTNARSWLVGEEAGAIAIDAPSDTQPGSFALDANGTRLAVVWEAGDGQVREITIHRRTAEGWPVVLRIEAPGDDPRAVVAWLR